MPHYTIHRVDSVRAEMTFHGVPYSEFDRLGHWSLWNIAKLHETTRYYAMSYGFLDTFSIMADTNTTVVVLKQTIRLNPNLHKQVVRNTQIQMRVSMKFLCMGTSSVIYKGAVSNSETGEFICDMWMKFVYIDTSTRRPTALPRSVKDKFYPFTLKEIGYGMDKSILPEIPSSCYKSTVRVQHSNTDSNRHVNHSEYIRYCMDCATEASMRKFYRKCNSDICNYPSTEWNMTYIGESVVNDQLDVYTWQDEDSPQRILFTINRGNKTLFHAETLFMLELNRQSRL